MLAPPTINTNAYANLLLNNLESWKAHTNDSQSRGRTALRSYEQATCQLSPSGANAHLLVLTSDYAFPSEE